MKRGTVVGAVVATLLSAAPSAGAQEAPRAPRPGPKEADSLDAKRPFTALSVRALSLRDSIVAVARAQIGRRYRTGGTSPEQGFDCSGLVRYVMSAISVHAPRTANEQASIGKGVARSLDALKPGDLLTFGSSRRVSHIGIYVGGGRVVHASTGAGHVIETPLATLKVPYIRPWFGVRRVVTGDSIAVVRDTTRVRG